jgi:hypothetical protein
VDPLQQPKNSFRSLAVDIPERFSADYFVLKFKMKQPAQQFNAISAAD